MNNVNIIEIEPYQSYDFLERSGLPTLDINPESSIFLGIFIKNNLVGCVGLELLGNIGLLRSLVVLERSRAKGLGNKLTRAIIDEANIKSLSSIYLLTTDAVRFFEKVGFSKIVKSTAPKEIKKTKQYSEICSDSAVVMKLSLC